MPSDTEIIITAPGGDDGGRGVPPRVSVTIVYNPPAYLSPAIVARTKRQLQKEADRIVAKYG